MTEPPASSRRAHGLALIALVALPFLLFPGAAIHRRVFALGDNRATHLPHALLMARELAEGSFPVWSRFWGCGYPLLAESQGGILYPPHLLLFGILETTWAFNLCILAHVSLAGCGAYALARRFTGSSAAPLFAGLAYVLSGPFSQKLGMAQLLQPRAWVPWAFLLVDMVATATGRGALRPAVLLGGVLAAEVLAGSPQEGYFTTMFTGLYLLLRAPAKLPWLLATYATLFLVAAPQFATTWELTGFTERAAGLEEQLAVREPTFLREVVYAFVPHVKPEALRLVPQGFVGLAVVALAAALLVAAPSRAAVAFAATALFAQVMALGGATPLWSLLLRIPGVSYFRFPERNALYFALPAILLAAMALGAPAGSAALGRARRALLVLLALLGAAGAVTLLVVYAGRGQLGSARHLGMLLGAAGAAAAPLVLLVPPRVRGALALLAALGSLAELRAVMASSDPTITLEEHHDVSAAGAWLAAHPGLHRVHVDSRRAFNPTPGVSTGANPYGGTLPGPVGDGDDTQRLLENEQVPITAANTGMRLTRATRLISAVEKRRAGAGMGRYRGDPVLLGLLNVRYLLVRNPLQDPDLAKVVDGPMRLFENRRVLPRARFVSRALVVTGSDKDEVDAVVALGERSADTIVLHEPGRELSGSATGSVTVDEAHLRSPEIRMHKSAGGPGYVTYAESWYPGWRAFLDGTEVPLLRANACFMAVPVPGGEHELVLRFWPRWLTGLLVASLAGCVLLGAAAAGKL